MTKEELKKVLELHKMWLHSEEGGVRADLSGCDLSGSNLSGSNLSGSDLSGSDLSGSDLEYANLSNTYLDVNKRIRFGTILKEPMTAWKKCKHEVIVKLEIPKGAIVFSINNSKCRTNKAKVVEITGAEEAYSKYDGNFMYHVGDEIEIENFNLQYNVECGTGIHFFRTREEAENY